MNSLFELIKVDLIETLDFRKFKENKTKSISFLSFILLMGAVFVAFSTYVSYSMVTLYDTVGVNLVYSMMLVGSLASFLCFYTSVFKVKSIFVGKDYDILRSMPIKKSYIITSKIINLYIVELLYSALFMIPNLVLCTMYSNDYNFIWIGLIATILIPAIPMVLAALFSLFTSLVADRYRFGNIINIILYILLFVAIFAFSFTTGYSSGSEEAVDISMFTNMADNMAWFNPGIYFIKFSFTSNLLYILLFVGINILALAIAISIVALLYDKVYYIVNSFNANYKYERKVLSTEGQFKALFARELKKFFKSKYYMLNCMSSGIAAIVMSAMMGYMFSPYSNMLPLEAVDPIREVAFIGVLFIIFGIGISTPASCSISMEGNTFWILKTQPINYKTMAKAKILASFVILGACSLISSIIMIVLVQPTVFSSVLLILFPLFFVLLASILGFTINLSLPKLKWKNEQECVKMSACIVITMLLDWLITILLGVSLIGLLFVNIYLSGLLSFGILIVATIISYIYTIKTVEKKMNKIEEF